MNGEEKILAILGRMDERLSGLESGQARLEKDVAGLKTDVAGLKTSVSLLSNAVSRLELIEVPKITAALDGLAADEEKLKDHEHRIISLEEMTERHVIEISVLKQARL